MNFRSLRALLIIIVALASALSTAFAQSNELRDRVVNAADDDTITVGDAPNEQFRIRPGGVNAQEKDQVFEQVSKQNLASPVFSNELVLLRKDFLVSKALGSDKEGKRTDVRIRLEASEADWWQKAVVAGAEVPTDKSQQSAATTPSAQKGFNWAAAIRQSFLFLGVQHGYALTQAKTRRELDGPFIRDYFRSVSKLGGWEDGGRFFTNYISHPMEGAITGFIQIQNDPKGIKQTVGKSRDYWVSRLKAMAWNAAYSTQFEIGPISQSSIGNVGLHTSLDGKQRKMAYVDLVVTPTLGTAWLVGEDLLDRYVLRRLEAKTTNLLWRNTARMLLNPMRGTANMLRFKPPWYREP